MNKAFIKKYLTTAVILLFMGLAFAPSIHANISREMVEFTTEVLGLDGGKQTVKLTKREVEEVDELFKSIRERLNETETREEAEEVFKDAVVELDKYGLLGGLSIKQAQSLVIGNSNRLDNNNLVERAYKHNKQSLVNNENRNCLIAGKTRFSLFASLSSIPRLIILFLLSQIRIYRGILMLNLMEKIHDLTNYSFPLLSFIYEKRHINIIALYFGLSLFLGIALPFLLPVDIGGIITFGFSFYYDPWYGDTYTPSKGWVFTSGQNGVIKWNNTFYGQFVGDVLCVGAIGYTGIKIWLPFNTFFLGFASKVKIDTTPP